MDRTTVSSNAVRGKFLGTSDRIVIGGNSPTANVQIQYSSFTNGINGIKSFQRVTEQSLKGHCVDIELCGVPRSAKTFVAVGLTDRLSGTGAVQLLDMETSLTLANLVSRDCNEFNSFSTFTSLTYHHDTELLAASTESGEIILYDLYTAKEVSRIRADPTGVSQIEFTRTGQLASIGDCQNGQLKLWDIRSRNTAFIGTGSSGSGSGTSQTLSKQVCAGSGSSPRSVTARDSPSSSPTPAVAVPLYSCLTVHPMQNKVLCGSSSGAVVVWDLRSAKSVSMQFKPHHSRGMGSYSNALLQCCAFTFTV